MSILCPACQESFKGSFLSLRIVCPHCRTDLSARISDSSSLSNILSAVLFLAFFSIYMPYVGYSETIAQGAKIAIAIVLLVVIYLISRFISFQMAVRKIKRLKPDDFN